MTDLDDCNKSYDDIPNDILPEILSHLPLKTLLQYRSVSKTWKNIIQHLVHRPNTLLKYSSFIFLGRKCFYGDRKQHLYLVYEEDDGVFKTKTIPWGGSPDHCDLYSNPYSNGLLCFSSKVFDKSKPRLCPTYIFNPSTQKFHRLPNFKSSCSRLENPNLVPRMGLDLATSKFKVVQIFNKDPHADAFIHVVGGSHSWRKIDNVPQVVCSSVGVTSNGNLHWLTTKPCSGILWFDLASEEFGFTEFPKFFCRALKLVDLGGRFSVCESGDSVDHVNIWIMRDYNLKEASWVKIIIEKVSVPAHELQGVKFRDVLPISVTKKGNMILVYDSLVLVSYNIRAKTYTPIEVGQVLGYNLNRRWKYHPTYLVYPYLGNMGL